MTGIDIIAELRAATLAAGVYPLAEGDTLELTAEMRLSDHLQPNFRRPFLDRPAKQQYANWAKTWKPVSVEGKAAKAYSRRCTPIKCQFAMKTIALVDRAASFAWQDARLTKRG